MRIFLLAVLGTCVFASPQYGKYSGIKGGGGGHGLQTGESLVRSNNTQYGNYEYDLSFGMRLTHEKGVCYIEVPTANLVEDPAHVPDGNGSRRDLSRIKTCCQGYTRNIYNHSICEPVCTKECWNALCTEPETCTCFPDHVKNQDGFCVPTCPIGCQHGRCAREECVCNDGYRLDAKGKFCIPICRNNCGGRGKCISPNKCECRDGYSSTPEGSCKTHCERCGEFAECVAPNDCRCRYGYEKNYQGKCVPRCENSCQPNGQCVAPNVCNYSTYTTVNSFSQSHPGAHNNSSNMETTRSPIYTRPQQPGYPGNQQPFSPGYHRSQYPNSNKDQFYQSEYQESFYPSDQPSYNPGNNPNLSPNHQNNYGIPSSNYPHLNSQNIYYNPGQQPPNYPGNQQVYYGQRPGFVDNQHPQSPSNNNNESHISGNQYYPGNQPGNQHHHPQYPQHQHPQGNYSSYNQSYTSNQQTQNIHPNSQFGNVERLCAESCINGVCIQRDTCSCNKGYVNDDTDRSGFSCKPYCPGGCPNGVCSAPDFCICNQGYYKDNSVKGRTNCVKRIRRSADTPENVADLLIFEIPDDEELYVL